VARGDAQIQGGVLHFGDRTGIAGEDEVADGDAAGVETHDERGTVPEA